MYTGAQTLTGGLPITASGLTLAIYRVGDYLILFNGTGTVIGTGMAPILAGTATQKSLLTPGVGLTDGMTEYAFAIRCSITNPGQTITLDVSTVTATADTVDVRIGPYAYANA
jgi:hypothetical protein